MTRKSTNGGKRRDRTERTKRDVDWGREDGGGRKGSDHKLRNDCSLEARGSRV